MFNPFRFYSAPEVWRLSHAPRALVYSALEQGELRAIRRGTRWLIPGASVIAWLEEEVIDASDSRANDEGPVRARRSRP